MEGGSFGGFSRKSLKILGLKILASKCTRWIWYIDVEVKKAVLLFEPFVNLTYFLVTCFILLTCIQCQCNLV